MKILVFLQNLWLKDPDRWRELLEGERRTEIISHLLFAYGCLTGRRIKACFGDDLVKRMIFEEASLEIADNPRTVCMPDPKHIRTCLDKYQPTVVLTFGKVAEDAVRSAREEWIMTASVAPGWSTLIACPHPAARQAGTIGKLKQAAAQLRGIIK